MFNRAAFIVRHSLLTCIALISTTSWGQGSIGPGPATGGGIDRSYNDGYVFVDGTGDSSGYTSNWGYDFASQIQGSLLVFHSESNLDANTLQVITDTYDLSGLIAVPPAPYTGSDSGGPLIPDAPASRTIEYIPVPEPSVLAILGIGMACLCAFRCAKAD